MSKKNIKYKIKKDNGYPLPQRTVLYSKKKHIKPVPEVGKKYHCFDDGKITFSRHYIVEITEILPYMEFKRKYPKQFRQYLETSKQCYWLYSRSTDYFAVCSDGENHEIDVFVRTKQGGWFSIGGFMNSGILDVTGKIWENLVENIDDFNYTDEEKKQLIKENL